MTATTHLPPIDPAHGPLLARPYLDPVSPSPVAGVIAHVPELLETAMPFFAAVYGPSALEDRLKEIVVLKISARNGCSYCTRVHDDIARAAGLGEEERGFLRGETTRSPFSERERAVSDFAASFCERRRSAIAPLRAFFRDDQIVELGLLAGTTVSLNHFCIAMGIV
ncbi:MAG: hypothetical protein NVSMB64_27760 [Candidatus Velthaea sp.]